MLACHTQKNIWGKERWGGIYWHYMSKHGLGWPSRALGSAQHGQTCSDTKTSCSPTTRLISSESPSSVCSATTSGGCRNPQPPRGLQKCLGNLYAVGYSHTSAFRIGAIHYISGQYWDNHTIGPSVTWHSTSSVAEAHPSYLKNTVRRPNTCKWRKFPEGTTNGAVQKSRGISSAVTQGSITPAARQGLPQPWGWAESGTEPAPSSLPGLPLLGGARPCPCETQFKVDRNRQSFISRVPGLLSAVQLREPWG